MKPTNHTKKRAAALLLALGALAALPLQAQSANPVIESTGVSDETLFMILAVIALFQTVVILVIAGAIKAVAGARALWNTSNTGKALALLALFTLASGSAVAATEHSYDSLVTMGDTGFIALIMLNAFLFIVFLYLTSKLNQLINMVRKQRDGYVPPSFFGKINALLNDSVPIEEEAAVEMDHEYDGIRELDNNLPPWWLYGFYASIVFAFVYIGYYHLSGEGELQVEEYQSALLAAEEAQAARLKAGAGETAAVDENNVQYMSDASDIKAGQKLFRLNCVTCHGPEGGSMPGGVGPNLTDDHWIHGGHINDIFHTIKYGVPAKGMQSWDRNFNPIQMQQLASYIVSIRGSNPENAKDPEGERWEGDPTEGGPQEEASNKVTPRDTAQLSE